ncbi:MAG TPA: hypothetical protein VK733_01705 [Gemmatimonadaceae bacterium]|jgi:hypothetical protein|nr:hypothetical protein [Gemmatimonadaceae bacterium]
MSKLVRWSRLLAAAIQAVFFDALAYSLSAVYALIIAWAIVTGLSALMHLDLSPQVKALFMAIFSVTQFGEVSRRLFKCRADIAVEKERYLNAQAGIRKLRDHP